MNTEKQLEDMVLPEAVSEGQGKNDMLILIFCFK